MIEIATGCIVCVTIAVLTVFAVIDLVAEHRVERENDRRRSAWLVAMADAKRNRTVPPFPPNRLMRR